MNDNIILVDLIIKYYSIRLVLHHEFQFYLIFSYNKIEWRNNPFIFSSDHT